MRIIRGASASLQPAHQKQTINLLKLNIHLSRLFALKTENKLLAIRVWRPGGFLDYFQHYVQVPVP
jgi:hypothetical protein